VEDRVRQEQLTTWQKSLIVGASIAGEREKDLERVRSIKNRQFKPKRSEIAA
jgi:hypothetical protein